MTFLLILLLTCFLLLLSFLLFAPLQLEINSLGKYCQINWGKLVKAKLLFLTDDILLQLQLTFYKKELYPLKYLFQKKEQKEEPKPKAKKQKKPTDFQRNFRFAKKILRSFKVRKCRLNFDTDDYILNAYLYPIFYFLNKGNRQFSINYEGNFDCHLLVENRGIWVIYSLLKVA